jgi:5-formyltetrahydrofolate cyclo-ligase
MDKAQMRQNLRTRLMELTDDERTTSSRKACQHLIDTDQFKRASVVMFYLSLPHEIDVKPAILHAWQQGKTVAVPKVSWQQRHMIPVEITSLETGVAIEAAGLRNPITGVPVPPDDIDLVVTPGLAFDKNGNRLGRGGSYYDRFFDSNKLGAYKCGFAFSQQIVEDVPTDVNDVRMDLVVTEAGVIKCK